MERLSRGVAALLIGLGLSLGAASSASAQEVPTGAARIVENVQTRIFISQATVTNRVAAIQANLPTLPGGE